MGAGVMGRHMCGHLVAKGLKATVFSRTIAKAEPLRLLGATLADSVAEVSMHMSQSYPDRSLTSLTAARLPATAMSCLPCSDFPLK